MSAKRIPLPPELGGGDVVMRTINVGRYEDTMAGQTSAKSVAAAFVEAESSLIMAAIVRFRGKSVPNDLTGREEWWRGQPLPMRQILKGYYNRLNVIADAKIEDFFAAAVAVSEEELLTAT